jgi:hypothetical protein
MTHTADIAAVERDQQMRDHAEALLDLLRSAEPVSEPFDIDHFVHCLLSRFGKVAAIWSIVDVQRIRPDLTDSQAWEVLEEVGRNHDAEHGIGWTTLEIHAAQLFPKPASSPKEKPHGN